MRGRLIAGAIQEVSISDWAVLRMQHDPNRPEDVLKMGAGEDGIGGDYAADALRKLHGL